MQFGSYGCHGLAVIGIKNETKTVKNVGSLDDVIRVLDKI